MSVLTGNRDSSVAILIRLLNGLPDRPGFGSWQRQEFFYFSEAFRPASGSAQSPPQRVTWRLSSWVKRPGPAADHSPLSTAETENA
jgi:hypothetical protein